MCIHIYVYIHTQICVYTYIYIYIIHIYIYIYRERERESGRLRGHDRVQGRAGVEQGALQPAGLSIRYYTIL